MCVELFRSKLVFPIFLVIIIGVCSPPSPPVLRISPSGAPLPRDPLTWDLWNGSRPTPWSVINATYLNLTNQISADIAKKYSYCFAGQQDLQSAFPPEQSSNFEQCFTEEDPSSRMCSRREVNIYFEALFTSTPIPSSHNCNETNWSRGCEPGWCINVELGDMNKGRWDDPQYLPLRTANPQPCCPGFYCPRSLGCMLPCPQGAYCPLGYFNTYWKNCIPYGYQLNPAITNNYCGGAHLWTDVVYSGMFCSPGYYCPNVTTSVACENGYYCRQGSTKQTKCLPFVRCFSQAEKQNIQVYGYFLITILSAVLVILYGCSDQLMTIQEKRRAGARELASRQARESIRSSTNKWAKTKQLARRLSGRLVKSTEEMQMLVSSSPPPPPPGKRTLPSITENEDLARHELDAAPSSSSGPAPRLGRRSEIFKYAYGQIERERMHLLDLPGRPRPRVEITFENLTMMLKKNGNKILSNVTGKLEPGRITAVMGPSGAGKTTFLNAVAGKAVQSNTTGKVLINGEQVSIQSFKQIIGFVPQDDIVHGALTVEENLYFSAKYRLSTDLPKHERVLVIERIIFALALDGVRDSLVGTVESRGISGGQRKRVNVGLEMVMEPSLLILDEPTSGLDSTSSRLVVEALRREALVGVNVVVVLHQPNYALFKMFDDVMFLAKQGRVAYLGPVERVESYFMELGYTVPARVNPPDYFMDVLEGNVPGEPSSGLGFIPLPVIWMQRMGYEIPEDLHEEAAELLVSETSAASKRNPSKTFSEEAWEEVTDSLLAFWDGLRSAFSNVEDLSGRTTPGFIKQYGYILERVSKQRFQEARLLAQDYTILLMTGICVGLLSDMKDYNLGSSAYTYTIIAVSLLCMIAALRTFSLDKLHFWRESASGINRVAYFLAKDTLDHFNTLLKPVVYLSMFYFFNDSRSTFLQNYIITVGLVYCVTGLAYIFAITLQSSTAQLVAVFFPILHTLIATKKRTGGVLDFLMDMTYARYAFEAYIVSNAARYDKVWLITRCGVLSRLGYRIDRVGFSIFLLFFYGFAARFVALLCLIFSNRSRQR